ncbi:hypothetical protein SMC26_08915 [Actinomadura fulvescens]|uniref:Immunity protein 35 domain-containing protein n=1 Tax=Actinomadura fulvescens TaxID=46160 RepID=A0ABN3QTS1_9ACTN
MSFDTPSSAAPDAETPTRIGERRTFLSVLDEAVREHGGMSCGVVRRAGVPVLHVINSEHACRRTEVGAEFVGSGWWFIWAETDGTIGPVEDPAGVAEAVGRYLGVHVRAVR